MASIRALRAENEELEQSLTRARGSAKTTRQRVQGAVNSVKLFGVRTLGVIGTVWHASGEKPTTSLWGFNVYRSAGVVLMAAGLARKMLGRGAGGDLLMAAGEGPLLTSIAFKTLNFRLRGVAAADKVKRAQSLLTRLGADDGGVSSVAHRLGDYAAEAVIDDGDAEEIAQLRAAINS